MGGGGGESGSGPSLQVIEGVWNTSTFGRGHELGVYHTLPTGLTSRRLPDDQGVGLEVPGSGLTVRVIAWIFSTGTQTSGSSPGGDLRWVMPFDVNSRPR